MERCASRADCHVGREELLKDEIAWRPRTSQSRSAGGLPGKLLQSGGEGILKKIYALSALGLRVARILIQKRRQKNNGL